MRSGRSHTFGLLHTSTAEHARIELSSILELRIVVFGRTILHDARFA
jgi:hypothetical protein